MAERLIENGIYDILLVDTNTKEAVKLSQAPQTNSLTHARQLGVLLPNCKVHSSGVSDGKKCSYNCEQHFINSKRLLVKKENTVQFLNLWDLKKPIHQIHNIETVKFATIQRKLDDPKQEQLIFFIMDSSKTV